MKTKFIYILAISIITASSAFAQKVVTSNIKVYGNCGMCKHRIETALDQAGIKTASWDPKTKNLQVVYNSNKLSEEKIHQIIASAGHDTDKVKAKDETYAKLPFCCLYRDHDHSGIKDDNPGHDHQK